MPGIVITKQETFTTINPQGKPYEQIRVTFTVDDDGPFYQLFPLEGFTGFAARQALETFAREVRTLRGQV
jgi:hypothetical protein